MLHTLHNCDCTNKLPHTVAVEESKHFACVEEKSECTFGISMPSLVLISINSTDFFSNCSLIFYEKPLIWHYINKTELNWIVCKPTYYYSTTLLNYLSSWYSSDSPVPPGWNQSHNLLLKQEHAKLSSMLPGLISRLRPSMLVTCSACLCPCNPIGFCLRTLFLSACCLPLRRVQFSLAFVVCSLPNYCSLSQ